MSGKRIKNNRNGGIPTPISESRENTRGDHTKPQSSKENKIEAINKKKE